MPNLRKLSHAVQSLPVKALTNLRPIHAVIHDLPPELLCHIFMICVTDAFYRDKIDTSNHSWTQITHVCRDWRIIALHCSNLWSYLIIDDTHERWARVMLQRSTSNLAVRATVSPKTLPLLNLALADPRRVYELDLTASEHDVQCIIDALPRFPLRALLLTITDPRPTGLPIPDQILHNSQYHLHTLRFSGINTTLMPLQLASLAQLDLSTPKQVTAEEVSHLMRTITTLTSLQSLSLNLRTYEENRIMGVTQTYLEKLQYISIEGHTGCLIDTLNLVRYPSGARLTCTLYRSSPESPGQQELSGLLARHCHSNEKHGSITSLLVEEYREDNWSRCALNGLRVIGYRELIPAFVFQYASPLDFTYHDLWLQSIWPGLPLDHVQSLRLHNEDCVNTNTWVSRTPLRNLRKIIISYSSTVFFRSFTVRGTTCDKTIELCPQLRELVFNDVNFAQGGHHRKCMDGVVNYRDERFSQHFVTFLRHRKNLKLPDLDVRLSGCSNISLQRLHDFENLCNLTYENLLPNTYPEDFVEQQKIEDSQSFLKASLVYCD